MTRTFEVHVTQVVEVTLDESKFTPEFLAEFNQTITRKESVKEHAEHLAWLHATGRHDMSIRSHEFVEGYGDVDELGITCRVMAAETNS